MNSENLYGFIKNCKWCGKAFQNKYSNICPECAKKDEDYFQRVRTYLRDYPGSKIDEVEQMTDVSRKRITRYLREGRIELVEANGALTCLKCGNPIKSGLYCDTCFKEHKDSLKSIYATSHSSEDYSGEMHLYKGDRIKNKHKRD